MEICHFGLSKDLRRIKALKKSKKFPCFMINLYLKYSAFTAVKKMQNSKLHVGM